MVTIPIAQAAASCIKDDDIPRPIAMINVNLVTEVPAFLIIKYPSRFVIPAFYREIAKIKQHIMKTTTGCI